MRKYLLPETGTFYKANLHCHSTCSDGKMTPEEIKKAYMEKGYSVVAYTDHDVMLDHSDLAEETFLPLLGYEMEINEKASPDNPFPYRRCCHMCLIALEPDNKTQVCWHREKYLFGNAVNHRDEVQFDPNEPDYERVYSGEGISDMMQKGRDSGFFVTYNHPVWSMETAENYLNYNGMHAMEICNYGCVESGFDDYVPYIYDEMIRNGKRIFCAANDDNHNGGENWAHDSFGGFNMIKAEKLEYRTITRALEEGNFYASQGPEIYDLYVEDGYVHITCSPAKMIQFNTGRRSAKKITAPDGQTVTQGSFELKIPDHHYFRLTVIDEHGKPANTRAYFMDELE